MAIGNRGNGALCIILPAPYHRRLGLKAGDAALLAWDTSGQTLVMQPVPFKNSQETAEAMGEKLMTSDSHNRKSSLNATTGACEFWENLPVADLNQDGLQGEISVTIQLIEGCKAAKDLSGIIRLTSLLSELKIKQSKLATSDSITQEQLRSFLRDMFNLLKTELLEDDYTRVMDKLEKKIPKS